MSMGLEGAVHKGDSLLPYWKKIKVFAEAGNPPGSNVSVAAVYLDSL